MKASPLVLLLAAGLLGLGSVSNHWFSTTHHTHQFTEGLLGATVCSFVPEGAGEDPLAAYAGWKEPGFVPPTLVWSCIRYSRVQEIVRPHNTMERFVAVFASIGTIAGLAVPLMLLVALRRRRALTRCIPVVASCGLLAAVVFGVTAVEQGYTVAGLGYGAVAYCIGAVLAISSSWWRQS